MRSPQIASALLVTVVSGSFFNSASENQVPCGLSGTDLSGTELLGTERQRQIVTRKQSLTILWLNSAAFVHRSPLTTPFVGSSQKSARRRSEEERFIRRM